MASNELITVKKRAEWNDGADEPEPVGIPSLIPLEMAAKLPNKTAMFPHDEKRRYIVALDVFHQLHCLVRPS